MWYGALWYAHRVPGAARGTKHSGAQQSSSGTPSSKPEVIVRRWETVMLDSVGADAEDQPGPRRELTAVEGVRSPSAMARAQSAAITDLPAEAQYHALSGPWPL
jgi:hypothetical protein